MIYWIYIFIQIVNRERERTHRSSTQLMTYIVQWSSHPQCLVDYTRYFLLIDKRTHIFMYDQKSTNRRNVLNTMEVYPVTSVLPFLAFYQWHIIIPNINSLSTIWISNNHYDPFQGRIFFLIHRFFFVWVKYSFVLIRYLFNWSLKTINRFFLCLDVFHLLNYRDITSQIQCFSSYLEYMRRKKIQESKEMSSKNDDNNNIQKRKKRKLEKKVNKERPDWQTKNIYWKVERRKISNVFQFFLFLLFFLLSMRKKKQSGDLPNTMRLCLYLLFSLTSGLKSLFLLYQSFFLT